MSSRTLFPRRLLLVLAVVACPAWLLGAKRPAPLAPGEFNPDHETVELFDAVEQEQLEVKFIPRNSKQARIFIKNKTDKPLNVQLPEAFAAVPVLAQFQPGGPGGNDPFGQQAGQGNAGGNQTVGGGLGNGRNGGNLNGALDGMFNVPAEKTGELRVACVCLEHGKPDPRPAIPYRLVPIESVTGDQTLPALLAMLGQDECDQRTAQAAAWHLASDMSWDELAEMRIRPLVGRTRPFFSSREMQDAKSLVGKAAGRWRAERAESVAESYRSAADDRLGK